MVEGLCWPQQSSAYSSGCGILHYIQVSGLNILYLSTHLGLLLWEGLLVVLGIIAIVGGIWALRRRSFGLSLAGAVCVLPLGILGIVAIVCIALAKREFEVGD